MVRRGDGIYLRAGPGSETSSPKRVRGKDPPGPWTSTLGALPAERPGAQHSRSAFPPLRRVWQSLHRAEGARAGGLSRAAEGQEALRGAKASGRGGGRRKP